MCTVFDPMPAVTDPGPSVVWYYRGCFTLGRAFGWHSALPVASRAAALAQAGEVERMGYPCVVLPVGVPAPMGRPAFWDFGALRRASGAAGEGA